MRMQEQPRRISIIRDSAGDSSVVRLLRGSVDDGGDRYIVTVNALRLYS